MAEAEPTVAPAPVRAAAALVAVEGVALVGLGIAEVISTIVSEAASVSLALTTAAVAAAGGALLFWLSRALRELRKPARSPVAAIQLVALPVGWTLTSTNGRPELGVPILLLAAGVLLGLFGTAEARDSLTREPFGD